MKRTLISLVFFSISSSLFAHALPKDFVYLRSYAPSILQDIRYDSYHNFVGRPINGYHANECILTKQAATQLAKVQHTLEQSGYSLKVYDCYRPQRAVDDFVAWSQDSHAIAMQAEFYPTVPKNKLFKEGYIAAKSGHSRGSTMDLSIVRVPTPQEEIYHRHQALVACAAPYHQRFHDNNIDMGTGFDCFSLKAHPLNNKVSLVAYQHRMLLRRLMIQYGFQPYFAEWWHFTLKHEPFPKTYFNFPVEPMPPIQTK